MKTPPFTLTVDPSRIPPELKARPGWVCWKWVYRQPKKEGEKEWTKPPLNPRTGQYAVPTDPTTGGSFAEAYQWMLDKGLPGVGVMLTAEDPFVVIDLDKVIPDGVIAPRAQEILEQFGTYAEPSPTGTGLHLIQRCAQLPQGRTNKDGIEVYWQNHYVTVTGHPLPGYDVISDCTEIFLPWHAKLSAEPASPASRPATKPSTAATLTFCSTPPLSSEDQDVITACRKMSSEKFARLYDHGDTSDYGGDHSCADAGLVGMLVKAGADENNIDRLFLSSALMRDKWEREDYRERTIALAMTTVVPGESTLSSEMQSRREIAQLKRQLANVEAEGRDNGELLYLISQIMQNGAIRNTRIVAAELAKKFLSFESRGAPRPYQISIAEVSRATGMSRSSVSRHIAKLADEGLLLRERESIPGNVDPSTGEISHPSEKTYLTPTGSAHDFARAAAELKLATSWGGRREGAFGRKAAAEAGQVTATEAQPRIHLGKDVSRGGRRLPSIRGRRDAFSHKGA